MKNLLISLTLLVSISTFASTKVSLVGEIAYRAIDNEPNENQDFIMVDQNSANALIGLEAQVKKVLIAYKAGYNSSSSKVENGKNFFTEFEAGYVFSDKSPVSLSYVRTQGEDYAGNGIKISKALNVNNSARFNIKVIDVKSEQFHERQINLGVSGSFALFE